MSRKHARLQSACYETEALLTEARKRLAELNVEVERTRGRLEYQAKQSGAIEQRIGQGRDGIAGARRAGDASRRGVGAAPGDGGGSSSHSR